MTYAPNYIIRLRRDPGLPQWRASGTVPAGPTHVRFVEAWGKSRKGAAAAYQMEAERVAALPPARPHTICPTDPP